MEKDIIKAILAAYPPEKLFKEHCLDRVAANVTLKKYESCLSILLFNKVVEGKEQLTLQVVVLNHEHNVSRVILEIIANDIIDGLLNPKNP